MSETAVLAPLHECIADELLAAGVEAAFGLMGEDTAKLVTHMAGLPGFSYYGARHEQMAVAMADGYARMSDRLGVAFLSRGPGLVNGLTAAISARKHGTPLLIVVGDSPAAERLADVAVRYPKHVRQTAIAEACDLVSVSVSGPEDVASATRGALERALAGEVVVLNVPTDLFNLEAPRGKPAPLLPVAPELPPVAAEDVERVAALIAASRRPVILAGGGASRGEAREQILALAERAGALLGTSLLAKDLFAGSRWDLGIVGGFASDSTRELLAAADLLLAFGASLNTFTSGGGKLFEGMTIVQVDSDPAQIGGTTPVDVGVVADAGAFAAALAPAVEPAERGRTAAVAERIGAAVAGPDYEDRSLPGELDPRTALRAIDAELPADRAVVIDAGAFSGYASQYLRVGHPSQFAFCLDFSAVGVGHGTGLGAAAARPGEATVLVVGDGGLLLTLGELETAHRCELPLVIVVMDDGAYGAERHYCDVVGIPIDQSVFGMVDFAGIATAIGIPSLTVREAADLKRIGALLAEHGGPVVIDVKINGALRPLWLEELYRATGYGR